MSMEKEVEGASRTKQAPPSELASPVPRNVRLRSTDGRFMSFVVLFCFGWGILLCSFYCYKCIRQGQQRDVLRRDGREATGAVIAISSHRGAPTSVSYTFSFDGARYFGKAEMPTFETMIFHSSDPIDVRFLPSSPIVNHPESWEWSLLGELEMGELLVPFLFGAGGVALIGLWRDLKLARDGKVAEGQVIDCTARKAGFCVKYEFCTDAGATIVGSCSCVEIYEEGAKIWVLYLPRRPRRNHSYPMDFFAVVE
jgi:hypothetical protein